MKVEIKGKTTEPLPYPKLMISTDKDIVVLFKSHREGTIVSDAKGKYNMGYYSDIWTMSYFVDLPVGTTVTLSNEYN